MRIQKLLSELLNRDVEVYSLAGSGSHTDRGMLESYDEDFIRIQKSNGETLYLGIRMIRLIKPKSN